MAGNTDIKSTNSPHHTVSEYVVVDEANAVADNQKIYQKHEKSVLPKGAREVEIPEDTSGATRKVEPPTAPRANVGNYHLLRLKTINGENYPLTDEQANNNQEVFESVSARKLISNPRGASIYRAEDFLYAKMYGLVPNNRMLTLRRFSYPAADDIFDTTYQTEPDVSRLIGFSDQETNKMSELMSFSFGLRWKALKSEFAQANYIGDQFGADGFAGKMMSYLDPGYGEQSLQGKNRLQYDPTVDTNKTFGPVDSIDSMHIRDVGLDFAQEIKVVFEYDMKSLNGLNQKAAFMDLLGNILVMSTNDAEFWGGHRYFVGRRRSKYADNLKFMEPKSFDEFLNGANVQIKGAISTFSGPSGASSAISTLKNIAKNALNMQFGKMLDKIGRPAIPSMRSLLTGDATGEHHLTIGNPLNPIMTIGDLIIKGTSLSFGDELGYDDFPTYMKAEITLEHNKTRDRGGIESMFNAGKGRIYMKPNNLIVPEGNVQSSKAEPDVISKILNMGANKLYGTFSKADILRNKFELWKMHGEDGPKA